MINLQIEKAGTSVEKLVVKKKKWTAPTLQIFGNNVIKSGIPILNVEQIYHGVLIEGHIS